MTRWWTRRMLLRTTAVTGLTGTAGCSTSLIRVPPPKPRVSIQSTSFDPDRLVIDRGETVTWWNVEDIVHTVTAYEERIPDEADYFASGGFDSEPVARKKYSPLAGRVEELETGRLRRDDRFEHRFTVPGHYHYFCIPHENGRTMAGTIVVRTEAGEIPSSREVVQPDTDHVVQMGATAFHPESLTIHTGDSVGWVNGTGIAHSVTGEGVVDSEDVAFYAAGRKFPEHGEYFASGGFDSLEAAVRDWNTARKGDVLPDKPFVHTFEEPGTYPYLCILHSGRMEGTVNVLEK